MSRRKMKEEKVTSVRTAIEETNAVNRQIKQNASVKKVLQSTGIEDTTAAILTQVHELGESSVNFICRPWTRTGDY